MVAYEIRLTKEAVKDINSLLPKAKKKVETVLRAVVSVDPFSGKKLVGDLTGFYSLRLSYKDRLVYSVDIKSKIIFVHRCRTHYGE